MTCWSSAAACPGRRLQYLPGPRRTQPRSRGTTVLNAGLRQLQRTYPDDRQLAHLADLARRAYRRLPREDRQRNPGAVLLCRTGVVLVAQPASAVGQPVRLDGRAVSAPSRCLARPCAAGRSGHSSTGDGAGADLEARYPPGGRQSTNSNQATRTGGATLGPLQGILA